jgi:plasmid stability protein
MAKAINVRGLDDNVHAALQRRAARSGRSVEAEARAILAEACLPAWTQNWAVGLRERAKARTGGLRQTDSGDLIREARDGRC